MYYMYRHIRDDKNEPFYIGIGKKEKTCKSYNTIYRRAFTDRSRSDYWKNIVSKTSYSVEILFETDSDIDIQNKEIEFIALYGRLDNNTGTLCNLTDGGETGLNRSKTATLKQIETQKNSGTYGLMVERMRELGKVKGRRGNNVGKPVYIYSVNGNFVKKENSRQECALFTKLNHSYIGDLISKRLSGNGYILSNEYLGKTIDTSLYNIKKPRSQRVIKMSPTSGDVLCVYDSISKACISNSATRFGIKNSILKGGISSGFRWDYENY